MNHISYCDGCEFYEHSDNLFELAKLAIDHTKETKHLTSITVDYLAETFQIIIEEE